MKDYTKLIKELRHNQTLPEQVFWKAIRNRRFANFKFRRQVQIGPYIVDFICYQKNLIIELDGSEHLTEDKVRYDNKRTNYLKSRNFKVIRYFNNDILNHIDRVLLDLWNNLNE